TLELLGYRDQRFAGGVQAQTLRKAIEQSGPAKSRLERCQATSHRRLTEPECAAGAAQRTVAGNREEDADIVPIHQRRAVAVRHDTRLYRWIPLLSMSEIIMYRYVVCHASGAKGGGKVITILDLNTELAKLNMLRARTPQTSRAEREG